MADNGRVVTTKLADELVSRLDAVSERIERSKSWIIRMALEQWLAEEQLRHQLTLDALADVDQQRLVDQDEMDSWARSLATVKKAPAHA